MGVTPPARELVPGDVIRVRLGDVIRVRLGDIVPADARLLDKDLLEVDQSALTGESLPTPRKRGEAVFSGSIVRRGETDALVYATGANAYFGKTAQLVWAAYTVRQRQRPVRNMRHAKIIQNAMVLAWATQLGALVCTQCGRVRVSLPGETQ